MRPSVSVCIATYNGALFLKEQLESILIQLKENDEIIISDNYSTDETVQIIESFKDHRIKLFFSVRQSTQANINCIKNFENALGNATGDYIFLSDQDDLWKKNKVEESLKYLELYDLIVSDCKIINQNNEIILDSYFKRRNSGKGFIKNFHANTYLGCCMAFRKQILKVILPFPNKIPMHDIWIGFACHFFCKAFFINEPLVLYREHQYNISPTSNGISDYNLLQKTMFRFNLLRYIPLILFRKWN